MTEGLVLGVLGCENPTLAARFFEVLTARTPAVRDQDHLHVLLTSGLPADNKPAVQPGRPNPDHRFRSLLHAATRLRMAGANVLVVPSDSGGLRADDIENAVSLPMIRWVDVAVAAALSLGGQTAILANREILDSHVYQRCFERSGGRYLVPPLDVQALLHACVSAPPRVASDYLVSACRDVAHLGASNVLLTSERLASLADNTVLPLPVIDPSTAVADRLVELRYSYTEHPTCA